MESCNSGSISSSDGGDDVYDSRATESSFSAFLTNSNPLTHVGPMANPPPPPQPPSDHHSHHNHHQTHLFDPMLANFFDPSSRSSLTVSSTPNSLLNLDMVWSKNLRSDPNCTDLGNFMSSSSPTQQFFTNQTQSQTRPTFNPSVQIPQVQETASRGPGLASSDNQPPTANMARNPKKRSRASRRAPTTVLTTDTTNFRAMVQEFTGIPAPPFTASGFPRTRLDLFGNSAVSSFRSAATSHLDSHPLPSYLLRPFAQKIQPQFFSSHTPITTTSMIDALSNNSTTPNLNNNANNLTTTTTSTTSSSSSDLGMLKYPQNLLNMQQHNNQILNFHSLLQPKFPLSNSSILGNNENTTKSLRHESLELQTNNPHLKMGVLEEFGLGHGHVNTNLSGLQNIVSSADTELRRTGGNQWENEGDQGDLLRSINGNYNSSNTQRVVNVAASSSDFRLANDKRPNQETNAVNNSRSEGMVESWICSSD